jgi:hypothetical protein
MDSKEWRAVGGVAAVIFFAFAIAFVPFPPTPRPGLEQAIPWCPSAGLASWADDEPIWNVQAIVQVLKQHGWTGVHHSAPPNAPIFRTDDGGLGRPALYHISAICDFALESEAPK